MCGYVFELCVWVGCIGRGLDLEVFSCILKLVVLIDLDVGVGCLS
jgi:hypothetical protein